MRILVIDNDESFGPLVRDVMASYFKQEVMIVDQVAECPKVVANMLVGVDIAMIDTEMVDREGINCMKAIRGTHKYLPVIMLADTKNADFTQICLEAGADDYVMKENVRRLLPDTVKSAIERRNKKVLVQDETERRGLRLESLKDRVDLGIAALSRNSHRHT